jgi:SAM-dependent methyltransferase
VTDPAARNHEVYSDALVAEEYSTDSWICAGEMRVFRELAGRARGSRLLDIGVGAGRTTSLLSLITSDYVGVDFSAQMIATATARHPYADLRVADARALSEFGDGEFGTVSFSFNGIDTLGHEDRALVFAQMNRVLAPGGLLVYSTGNSDGPERRQRPWRGLGPPHHIHGLPGYLWKLHYAARCLPHWWRARRLTEDHGDWAIGMVSAHRYRLLVHYVTLPEAERELRAAGFEPLVVVDEQGIDIELAQRDSSRYGAFILARKLG